MLAVLPEPATARAVPLWLDPDLNREAKSRPGGSWRADFPSPANDDVEQFLSLDEYLIRNPEATFLMRVTGEALADAGLHDGDLLVMDRATPPLAGSVALVIVEGVAVLAHLGRDAQGRLRVQAVGTDLSQPLDEATMVGVARWVIHRLWPGRRSS
ncbi:MAG: S24 family peptidase [Candidatus Competibacteraceae bacterium]